MDPEREPLDISRRNLLIGGGVGAGLLIAWAAWPRRYEPNLRAAPGEAIFNAYLKIGNDGRVVVAVPQSELGQGVYTSLPQILADELGADWRTVSVEPAPISPIYANRLLVEDIAAEAVPPALRGIGGWAVREYATRSGLMLTAGSTSIRAFEAAMREAGAAGRALLSKAAADRWDVDWESLDTRAGFVVRGKDRISFGELADAAAAHDLPKHLPVRGGNEHRLAGQPLPRLDLPSKVDGSAQYACDIRLPNMVYASVRQGPAGDARLVRADRTAAGKVPGVVALIEQPGWIGAVATNWWAANRAVERMAPRFETYGPLIGSGEVDAVLARALDGGEGSRLFSRGDADAVIDGAAQGGGKVFRARYQVGLAPSAPLETLAATVRITGDRVEVWAPTQAPGFARAAAARAAGVSEAQVTLYRTLIGGGYGRKLETQAIEQAVIMTLQVKRPVQLVWSRIEETMHDGFRPPARAQLTASLTQTNIIAGWRARIAAPSTVAEVSGRLHGGKPGPQDDSEEAAVAGAVPPYAIGAVAVDHLPAAVGVRTGIWRSGAHSYTGFFTECFIDELARQAKIEPLSFRMQMLGDNPRLARVLSTAAAQPAGSPTFDPNDPRFVAPGDMPSRIVEAYRDAGDPPPETPAAVVRAILDSLARAFRLTLADAEQLSGRVARRIHVVGGGSRNELLCQLTADACELPVVAGPAEATAIGNVVIQARSMGMIRGDLGVLRGLVRATQPSRSYHPRSRAELATQ